MKDDNRGLFALLGLLVLVLFVSPVFMGGMMGVGVMGPGMMGWGYSGPGGLAAGNRWAWGLGMGVGGLMMLPFWGALIVGLVLLARQRTTHGTGSTPPVDAEDPLAILHRRYATGDIDQPTYQRMKTELGEGEPPASRPPGVNGSAGVAR